MNKNKGGKKERKSKENSRKEEESDKKKRKKADEGKVKDPKKGKKKKVEGVKNTRNEKEEVSNTNEGNLPPFLVSESTENPFYVKLEDLRPSQLRYSKTNVQEKINKLNKKGNVKYRNGLSNFPPEKAFPVGLCQLFFLKRWLILKLIKVKGKSGYYLIDGHHHVLAGIALGKLQLVFSKD